MRIHQSRGLAAAGAGPLCSDGAASAQPRVGEMFVNPPGSERGFEGIERAGSTGASFAGYCLNTIEGVPRAQRG